LLATIAYNPLVGLHSCTLFALLRYILSSYAVIILLL